MSNEELAEAGRKHARAMFKAGLKSGNKIYSESARKLRKSNQVDRRIMNQHAANKAIESNRETASLMAECDAFGGGRVEEDKVNAEILKLVAEADPSERAGNCLEYALVARNHIIGLKRDASVTVIRLEGGDHVFVAVGLSGPGNLAKDITTWGEDVWICDPWANIACCCKDYPTRWKAKLDYWMGRGKYLLFGNRRDKPTDKFWYSAMEVCEKKVVAT